MPDEDAKDKKAKKIKMEEQLIADIIAQQNNMKDRLNPVKKAEKMLKKAEKAKNAKGELYWDSVMAKADDMINKNFTGYNSWELAMYELVLFGREIGRALSKDPINPLGIISNVAAHILPTKFNKVVSKAPKEIMRTITNHTTDKWAIQAQHALSKDNMVYNKLPKFISNTIRPKNPLPEMTYAAKLDDEGHIETTVYKDDTVDMRFTEDFDAGVSAWAQKNGYEATKDAKGTQFKKDGEFMSQEDFDDLNSNEVTSLKNFLTERSDVSLGLRTPRV